jgi:biotin transport system substrate-specific component
MSGVAYIDRYRANRLRVFERLNSLSFANKAALSLTFALLTGLSAQVRIYTPFSPVPFTLQVLPVLLAGAVLGRYFGGASQLAYLAMGAAGLPVFAGWRFGPAVLLGPTGGYLIGFLLAAFVTGWLVHSSDNARSTPRILLAMVAGMGIIYTLGTLQLALLLGLDARQAVGVGILPFVGLDLVKILAAAGLARAALPGARA